MGVRALLYFATQRCMGDDNDCMGWTAAEFLVHGRQGLAFGTDCQLAERTAGFLLHLLPEALGRMSDNDL